jgi:hypothetical protein
MNGKSGIVGFDNGVRDLGRRNNGKGCHHAVWELLTNFGDQKRTHTSTSSTTERVGDLEALEAVAALSFTSDHIKNLVDKLSTFSVMTLSPVVSSTRLAKDKVVRTEQLTEWASADSIHGTRFQVDKDGTRNIFVAGCLQAGQYILSTRPLSKQQTSLK